MKGTLIWLISLSLDYNGMNHFQKINHNLEDYIIAVKIEVFNIYNQRVALFHTLFISQYIPSNKLGQIGGKKKTNKLGRRTNRAKDSGGLMSVCYPLSLYYIHQCFRL